MSANAFDLQFPEAADAPERASFSWFEIGNDPTAWDRLVEHGAQRMFNISPLLNAHATGGSSSAGVLLQQPGGGLLPMGALINKTPPRQSLKMLTFPALAATGDPELVVALSEWLFTQNIKEIQLDSYTGGVEGYRLPASGVNTRDRLEFEWNLQASDEQRFRALRSNHKRKLRHLLTEPLELRKIERYRAEQMTRLRVQWGRRRAMPSGFRQVAGMYLYHRFLHRELTRPGVANLYGLYDAAGRLLSLAYMLEVDDIAFYMIGASSVEGYKINSSLRLFWDLAAFYSSRNYKLLNLGGVPAEAISASHEEHGVLRFKAGFGIESTTRTSLSIKK
jgi:hypothetical protein